jgi:hypothetical protein
MARSEGAGTERDLSLLVLVADDARWCAICADATPHDRADAEAVCALCGAAVFVAGRLAWPDGAGHTPRAA